MESSLLLFYIVLDAFLMLIRFEEISYNNMSLNNIGLYENCVCARVPVRAAVLRLQVPVFGFWII